MLEIACNNNISPFVSGVYNIPLTKGLEMITSVFVGSNGKLTSKYHKKQKCHFDNLVLALKVIRFVKIGIVCKQHSSIYIYIYIYI